MIENWELRVWSPIGTGPRVISRDASHIPMAGIRMQLTPEGDCREMTFDAKGSGLGLHPLDCVQLAYGSTPLFYGELRMGGNVRDVNGHRHVLRSLTQRFKEVLLPAGFNAPQQAAHLTVRAALRAVVDSGQLGNPSTVLLDDALMPDLGFDCQAIADGRQQTLYELLELVVQGGLAWGVSVRFGVQPDRRFFCRAAVTSSRTLGRDELTGATQWKEPVAEVPVTAVLWYVAQENGRHDTGQWISHLSVSPESSIYGLRIKRVTWAGTVPVKTDTSARAQIRVGNKTYSVAGLQKINAADTDYPGSAQLWDGDGARSPIQVGGVLTITSAANEHIVVRLIRGGGSLGLHTAYVIHPVNDWVAREQWTNTTTTNSMSSEYAEREFIVRSSKEGVWPEYSVNRFTYSEILPSSATSSSSQEFELTAYAGATQGAQVDLQEFRPLVLDTAVLDGVAQHHFKSPAQEPANIELRTFIAPASLPKYVVLESYQSIVDAWEYRLSADRGLLLGCLTGQAEDPAALAQAELIKARDGQAVIQAITAGGK